MSCFRATLNSSRHPFMLPRYTFSVDGVIPPQKGYVRALTKYQGFVAWPERSGSGDEEATRITWLQSLDFGGTVPAIFVRTGALKMMAMPKTAAMRAERFDSDAVESHHLMPHWDEK